jgi:hypothetical protein
MSSMASRLFTSPMRRSRSDESLQPGNKLSFKEKFLEIPSSLAHLKELIHQCPGKGSQKHSEHPERQTENHAADFSDQNHSVLSLASINMIRTNTSA